MGLDIAQKSTLIQRFAPVLFVDTADADFPIQPEAFIERSALWSARVPYDSKMLWGIGMGSDRSPLLQRGEIRFDPIHPLILEHADTELWFETSGWARDVDVRAMTDNRTCNSATLDSPYQLAVDGPWFYAEVGDDTTMAGWFSSDVVRRHVGLDWNGFVEALGPVRVVCYYFLFPRHLEAGVLAQGDGSLEPAANFEGDWACYAVVTRPVDDMPEHDTPLLAGFSRARRGASGDFGSDFTQAVMELLPWDQVPSAADHAGVKVASGTHNLYPLDRTQGDPGGVRPQWFDFGSSVSEPGNKLAQDMLENPATQASSVVVLAKVLGGLALLGPLGAVGGAIAGVAEAAGIYEALAEDPELEPGEGTTPEWPDDLEDPRDKLLDPEDAQAIVPQGRADLVLALTGVDAATVSFWMEDGERTLMDRTQQLFWTDQMAPGHSYQGRWGVRCSDDPFNRRAGGKFPEFRLQVLRRLVMM